MPCLYLFGDKIQVVVAANRLEGGVWVGCFPCLGGGGFLWPNLIS